MAENGVLSSRGGQQQYNNGQLMNRAIIKFEGKNYVIAYGPHSKGKVVELVGEIIRGGNCLRATPREKQANERWGEFGIEIEPGDAYYVCREVAPGEAKRIMDGYNAQRDFGSLKKD